jgi:2-oxoglutarate ferredoxin oxidoreductase subunit gamma
MGKTTKFLFAGFVRGQGILFTGKLLAYTDFLRASNYAGCLPTVRMRGGHGNCSVILSDDPIGSPIVDNPTFSSQ